MRFELTTLCLEGRCSTPELRPLTVPSNAPLKFVDRLVRVGYRMPRPETSAFRLDVMHERKMFTHDNEERLTSGVVTSLIER